jgi:transposase, IS5 family
VNAGLVNTHQNGLIRGARPFPGIPYDGHTLAEQMEQTPCLQQNLDVKPQTAICDLGYWSVDSTRTVTIIHRGC